MEEKRSGISFGFSRTRESKIIAAVDNKLNKNETKVISVENDFLTAIEGKQIKSAKTHKEEKELVIPLIEYNRWRNARRPEDLDQEASHIQQEDKAGAASVVTGDEATDSAVKEILQDAATLQEKWQNRDKADQGMAIPLLMRNKVPDGFEEDDKLDVSLRPSEAEPADYETVPIEQYGVAMLRGMGWKPGQGIGRNAQAVKPPDAILRPKGLGLGADKSLLQQADRSKHNGAVEHGEALEITKGCFCIITGGKHKDLYGTIEGVDGDNARTMVKLAINSQVLTISQYAVKLVTKKEFTKYSLKKPKSTESSKEKDSHRTIENEHSDRHNQKNGISHHRHRDGSSKHETKEQHNQGSERRHHREREPNDSKHRHKHKRHGRYSQDDDAEERGSKLKHARRKESTDRSPLEKPSTSIKDDRLSFPDQHLKDRLWVRPNMRVRIIDPEYQNGKYFKKKVVIEDVVSEDCCICKTEDGKVLDGLSQNMVETVIPRTEEAHVMLIAGCYKGQLALVLRRKKESCEATLQLLSDRDKVVNMSYDTICEYTGDINREFDY